MTTCPKCGHEFFVKDMRLKDTEILTKRIDELMGLFGDNAEAVRKFIAAARNARAGGMAATRTATLLEDFYECHQQNAPAFGHALRAALQSDRFDWSRPNLFGYVKAVFKSTVEKGVPMSAEDLADELATTMISVWHRFEYIERLTDVSMADIGRGKLVLHVARAMLQKSPGWLPHDAPPHKFLAGHIREVLAEKAAKRKAMSEPQTKASGVHGSIPDALRADAEELARIAEERKAERERTENEVWDERGDKNERLS